MSVKVTVCIPTYNAGELLREAVSSALAQTWRDLEVLVLDNASTDATPALVASFTDPRVRCVRHDRNLGYAGNLAKGLELARGEYAAFLCADDAWRPGLLEQAVRVLDAEPDVAFVHTGHALVSHPERRTLETRVYPWEDRTGTAAFFKGVREFGIGGICLSSTVFRRRLAQDAGGVNTALSFSPDVDLWLRLSARGRAAYLHEVLTVYRVHGRSLTSELQKTGVHVRDKVAMIRSVFSDAEVRRTVPAAEQAGFVDTVMKRALLSLPILRGAGVSGDEIARMYSDFNDCHPAIGRWPLAWLCRAVGGSALLSRGAYRVGCAAGVVPVMKRPAA